MNTIAVIIKFEYRLAMSMEPTICVICHCDILSGKGKVGNDRNSGNKKQIDVRSKTNPVKSDTNDIAV